MTILVIEDEKDFSDILCYMLRRDGHDVMAAYDGETGLTLWRQYAPELIILDLALPHASGWDVCREIRRQSATPIVIISGSNGDNEVARGFDMGADDFITKPFSPRVTQARIRAVLRRQREQRNHERGAVTAATADLELDPDLRRLRCRLREVQLTSIETQILRTLLAQRGQVVSHRDLIETVWGYRDETGSKLLKGHILNLRKKLAELHSDSTIQIISGFGYLLEEREVPARAV